MMDMEFHMALAPLSDKYKNYAEALYLALKSDAFYITMEKSVEEGKSSKEAMLRYMEYSMVEAELYGKLYIPADHKYGVSIWSKPLSKQLEARKSREKKDFLCNHMGKECLKKYNAIVEFMAAQAISHIGKESWYLSIVGVLPEFQGQGLGPGLVNNILEKTDSMNIPTYLETFTPRNMSFYIRLGFKVIESFHEPTTDARYWLMGREPMGMGRT